MSQSLHQLIGRMIGPPAPAAPGTPRTAAPPPREPVEVLLGRVISPPASAERSVPSGPTVAPHPAVVIPPPAV